MNHPFFSIIIPTYNRAYILKNTIDSVLGQTFSDFELIVVDDGSTDNTADFIATYSDKRLRYIYQNNAERSAARNNGIRNSLGKYICFLDSDDWYESNHLQVLFDNIKTTNFKIALFFTNCFYWENEKKIKQNSPSMNNTPPLQYHLQNPIIPARVCIHSEILKKYKFREDIVIVEDQVLWVTIAAHFPVIQISENTVVYRLHENNSVNIKRNCYRERLNGMRLLFKQKDMQKLIPLKLKSDIISNCYYGIAKHYADKKKRTPMTLNILFSLVYSPFNIQTKSKIYLLLFPSKSGL